MEYLPPQPPSAKELVDTLNKPELYSKYHLIYNYITILIKKMIIIDDK